MLMILSFKHYTFNQCCCDVNPNFYDAGPTSKQDLLSVSCLLGDPIKEQKPVANFFYKYVSFSLALQWY